MNPHQRFRQGARVELLAVRRDKITGELYSRITDIQRSFPDASLFKVNGVVLNFLEDENEQLYEPNRIAHYPDDVVDIVAASSSSSFYSNISPQDVRLQAQWHLDDNLSAAMSTVALESSLPTHSYTLGPASPLGILTLPASSSTSSLYQTTSIARPMAVLSSVASEISQIQAKLDHSTEDQSAHHVQLMQQLFQMVQRQNDTLTQLAEAKEREEKMLQELAAAKARDEEMHRMQQQAIDRLIVAQQRIDAILVQNYELHEYPIPRLFVILPDAYEKWDPRSLLMERFRLYFLCECGEDCAKDVTHGSSSGQLTIAAAAFTPPIAIKNSIHLAKHEGYELSRPTEFFDQYGPYVLGMLRILKHCLAVTTVIAPAVALAEESIKDTMDGVKSISESTMEAVNMSINFLEQKLDNETVVDAGSRANNVDQEEDMFKDLAALEGADLRRLGTFLRRKDADKILGNLYRITTDQGQVKWVCFDHYKETYRQTALDAFVLAVKSAGGIYDPHFRKVTISLASSTSAKDFFKRLANQAPAIDVLDVSMDWKFGPSDLVMIADMLNRTNVRTFNLDLKDFEVENTTIAALFSGKKRYHALFDLFSGTKLRGLSLTNLLPLATRMPDLPFNRRPSLLQSFHYQQKVTAGDNSRLADILHLCTALVDVRLGSRTENNMVDRPIHHAISSLTKLQVLHLYGLGGADNNEDETIILSATKSLKDVVCTAVTRTPGYLRRAIKAAQDRLEVLVLRDITSENQAFDLASTRLLTSAARSGSRQSEKTLFVEPHSGFTLSRLSHLTIATKMTDNAIKILASVLPRLDLIHFGTGRHSRALLQHVRVQSLKSLAISLMHEDDAQALTDYLVRQIEVSQLDSMMIECNFPINIDLQGLLGRFPLKRLSLSLSDGEVMKTMLKSLNFSRLGVLSLFCKEYNWEAEGILQSRSGDFREDFVVDLRYSRYWVHQDVFLEGSRTAKGLYPKLGRDRVLLHVSDHEREYLRFLHSTLPIYTY